MNDSIILQKRYLDFRLLLAVFFTTVFYLSPAGAAPSPDLWPRRQAHEPYSTTIIDHTSWDNLLKKYLVTGHPSGINRFRYGEFGLAGGIAKAASEG